jgi:DNA-binding NtrC family response regulator
VFRSVLVVDDDGSIRELLRRWLQHWGYDVRIARDAATALEAMLERPADIVLADIHMPGADGLWLTQMIREKWPRTAVILATGVVEVDTVAKAQRVGAVDYITKPFGREMLRQALTRAEQQLHESK